MTEATVTAPELSPASTGETVEQMKVRLAELEKESEGRLRDLQKEREKVQELRSKIPAPASPAEPDPGVTQDEVGKVLQPHIAPVAKRIAATEQFIAEQIRDKSVTYLAAKTGKTEAAVLKDQALLDRMEDIARRFGLTGNLYQTTVKAYEILELENVKAQDEERKRLASANGGSASLPTGTHVPAATSSRSWSESEWNSMPSQEYAELEKKGSFRMDPITHVFTFTPRPK